MSTIIDRAFLVDARLQRLKRNVDYLSDRLRSEELGGADKGPAPTDRRRAAVVCWDLAHNPVGRAYVLTQLLTPEWLPTLIGPIWPRFGDTLWEPLQNAGVPWHGIKAESLLDVLQEGTAFALTERFDLVIVSKPRLPGLLLGLLLAEQSRCPLVFDFDEDERAFLTHHREAPGEAAEKLLYEPFGTAGTMLATQFWSLADAVTIASQGLRKTLGGHLVRHARDESAPLSNRDAARQRFGYRPDDIVLAFIGTVRAHKGLDRVVEAMVAVESRRVKLLVVGTLGDPAARRSLERLPADQCRILGNCGIEMIGEYLAAADIVPLLQDPTAAISGTQFPAKLTDALQYGVQVVATQTPALNDSCLADAVHWIAPDGFAEYLKQRLNGRFAASQRVLIRRVFEDDFSYRVNRVRLDAAISEAEWAHNPFGHRASDALRSIIDAIRQAQKELTPGSLAVPSLIRHDPRLDVAFFWKQNDSDLFGRRSDMVTRHLIKSGRVRRIIHFDRPVARADMVRWATARMTGQHSIAGMQVPTTIRRVLRLNDSEPLIRRAIMTRKGNDPRRLAGQALYDGRDVPSLVAETLRTEGFEPESTIAWVCPVVWDFPAIHDAVKFRHVIADLIDDERTWASRAEQRRRVHEAYRETLAIADLVLTNAEGNRKHFSDLKEDIHVVPNGAEFDPPPHDLALPAFMLKAKRPIIGYCGNMSERIDWDLLDGLLARHPDWHFEMIGPQGEKGVPDAVAARPNIVLPGPLSYDLARRCMGAFDCAIVPHLRNGITNAMNPLKVYNYLSSGVPVVSTPVANLRELRDFMRIAEGVDGFSAAIAAALAEAPEANLDMERMRQAFSWDRRVADILDLIDTEMETSAFRRWFMRPGAPR
ncbi:MAG: glycosyltransferase [Acetobacteraceae bacterium]